MKRFIVLGVVVAFVAAIPLSHMLMAQNPKKAFLCHITNVETRDVNNVPTEFFIGKVIEVSLNAVPAHCAHGDHTPATGNWTIGNDCHRKVLRATATCGPDKLPLENPNWYK